MLVLLTGSGGPILREKSDFEKCGNKLVFQPIFCGRGPFILSSATENVIFYTFTLRIEPFETGTKSCN